MRKLLPYTLIAAIILAGFLTIAFTTEEESQSMYYTVTLVTAPRTKPALHIEDGITTEEIEMEKLEDFMIGVNKKCSEGFVVDHWILGAPNVGLKGSVTLICILRRIK